MLPEVNHFLSKNIASGAFPDTGMPIAEILTLCGFFMIYIVEEITHLLIDKCQCCGAGEKEKVGGT